MKNLQDTIVEVKEALPNLTPTPPSLKAESSAYDLKSRLEWGGPALTIVDIRDRETFNEGHITGAVPMPMDRGASHLSRFMNHYARHKLLML